MLSAIAYESVWLHFETGVCIASVTAIPVLETSFQDTVGKTEKCCVCEVYCVVAMAED